VRNLEAIAARARGLRTHLLPVQQVQALAQAASLNELVEALRAGTKSNRFDVPADAVSLERALLHWGGDLTQLLERWLRLRPPVASVLFLEDQLHAVRRITRGIMAGHPPGWRLAGLVAVPDLPYRVLQELAGRAALSEVAGLLLLQGSPFAHAVAEEAGQASPDAFRLDVALGRAFAAALAARARAAGGECLEYAREVIDAENAATALVVVEHSRDVQPDAHFLPGGAQISAATFAAAVAEHSANGALRVLADGSTGWLMRAFQDSHAYLSPDAAILRARIDHHRTLARMTPVSLSAAAYFLLHVRAQLADLRRVIWVVATGAPTRDIAGALVEAL
jgi:vacuolar-type H+-ATPase subunit C/Vma6